MSITLAFYKGRGQSAVNRLSDGVIRLATRGIYSHVELVLPETSSQGSAVCLSSSGRDGGVREKRIKLKSDSWDVVSIDADAGAAEQFIRDHMRASYDYRGIMFSQVLSLARHDPTKWFCSEICAAAIGILNPQRMSPQLLFDVVTWRSAA